ncbi:hypothetical protein EDD11_005391 [Mortierella claussenii]|nr:hypothetical protein EDD11_005391 [Mortierella claussenii]
MKLFKLDFGIKDRYRRGLAQGPRVTRSPQSEAAASFNEHNALEHDPHHQATSPSSPSVLFSAGLPSFKTRGEPMEQWNQLGSSSLEAFPATDDSHDSRDQRGVNNNVQTFNAATAHTHARGGRHIGQEYDNGDEYEHESSNDGYLSSSSTSSTSSGGSLSSSSSLSPSSSHSSDEDEGGGNDSDGYDDEDDNMQGNSARAGDDDAGDHENDSSSFSHGQYHRNNNNNNHYHRRHPHDFYGGRHGTGEHGGLLPRAPVPAIEPLSDREALEQEARQRRLERHIDKRRQSLNGTQPPPAPRRKKRKKAKDLPETPARDRIDEEADDGDVSGAYDDEGDDEADDEADDEVGVNRYEQDKEEEEEGDSESDSENESDEAEDDENGRYSNDSSSSSSDEEASNGGPGNGPDDSDEDDSDEWSVGTSETIEPMDDSGDEEKYHDRPSLPFSLPPKGHVFDSLPKV